MKGIIIKPLSPVNVIDIRGPTYEWCKGLPGKQITFCIRKEKAITGNHYHKGLDPSKKPERAIILKGNIRLIAFDGKELIDNLVSPWNEIIISPNIVHTYIPQEECLFAEYRETVFNRDNTDTFPSSTFPDYLKLQNMPFNEGLFNKFIEICSQ